MNEWRGWKGLRRVVRGGEGYNGSGDDGGGEKEIKVREAKRSLTAPL